MKKYLSLGAMVAFLGIAATTFGQQIQVIVNGNPVGFPGQQPAMIDDRLLVPLRGVLEAMGAHVDWDPSTQTVSARRGATVVKLAIGQRTASVGGNPVTLDVAAQIIDGSTMVPLRFVGEALGEDVHWESATNTVTINGGDDFRGHDHDHDHDHDHNFHPNGPPPPPPHPQVTFVQNTIIPVSLNISIGSDNCQPGQRISTVVNHYPGIPDGCRVEGTVADVSPTVGIEFNFDTLITPAGRRIPIHGKAVALGGPGVQQRPDGRFVAKGSTQNSRFVFANHHGAPTLVSVANHATMADPKMAKEIHKHGPDQHAVHVPSGIKFGIRLDAGIKIPK